MLHFNFLFFLLHLTALHEVSSSALFQRIDPNLLKLGNLKVCDPKPLKVWDLGLTASSDCALLCSMESECLSYLFDPGNRRCKLMSSRWCRAWNPELAPDLMVRQKKVVRKSWRFNGSLYVQTNTSGTFEAMRAACTETGMYLFSPDNKEEDRFIFNNIVKPSGHKESHGDTQSYQFWIGVKEKDSSCRLQDDTTPCEYVNFDLSEPAVGKEKCTNYMFKNGKFVWNDVPCDITFYGICEGEMNAFHD